MCCFDKKKVELFIYFKKVEGEVWPGDDTEDRGKGRIQIVKDVWRSNEKSLDPDVFCGKRGLDNQPKLLLQVLKN